MLMRGTIDTLATRGGLVSSFQSCTVAPARAIGPDDLANFGAAYFDYLERLPGVAVMRGACGERAFAPPGLRLPLLRFAAPYIVAAHSGSELRYHIRGGLMAAQPGGWFGFGCRAEAEGVRLWIAVAGYRPRLGAGPLYRWTQARFHQWISLAFLKRWAGRIACDG